MEEELKLAQTVISSEANSEQVSWDLFKKKNWKPLYISTCFWCFRNVCFQALSVVVFQQATGQPSVLYYAQELLQKANILSDSSEASSAFVI